MHLLEIKAGATINNDYFKGLRQFKKAFPEQYLDGTVLYAGDQPQPRSNWQVLPWHAGDTEKENT